MKRSPITLNDIFITAGLIMLAYGLYLAWPPLALIIPGAVLILVGYAGASRERAAVNGAGE